MRKLLMTVAATAFLAMGGAAAAQDFDADPHYGELNLSAGFTPDPSMMSILAGGRVDAGSRFSECSGFISDSPDVRLFWTGNPKTGPNLKISVISNADTTLVINGPDGRWHCDDDSGEDANPLVELQPQSGRYEIWVGTYSEGENKRAVLSISEVSSF